MSIGTITRDEKNTFSVEVVRGVADHTYHLYGVASATGNYMRTTFVARYMDDEAFVLRMVKDLNDGKSVDLSADYDERSDEFWFNFYGWTYKIERLFDWR